MTGIKWTRKKKVITTIISGLLIWFAFCLPSELFNDPLSTVLNDRDNRLIAASIASDGQWRFPQNDSIPRKFREAIVYFEDEYFFYHPGVNPVSMVKAIVQNIKAGKIVRGGSTLAVQTIRMSRKGQARTYLEKIIESIQALRLELRLSKQEILSLYSSNAPFGGNVVGLEAASWRYYGRPPHQLSWGETTALAVLPNAPALIYPGRNQDLLRAKRDRLLDKLQANNIIDSLTCLLAKDEPLPQKPKPLPQLTEHLLTRSVAEGKNEQRIKTTIDSKIQQQAVQVIEKHHRILKENEIANAAAIIVNAKTGEVLAYVGNTKKENEYHGNDVDIITAKRSSGSILKPFLYAFMQKEGQLLPNMLVPDIPTQFAGYTPKNFDKKYDGAVPADNALARSLNIPAVRMLRDYGIEKFCQQLKDLGFSSIDKSAGHYGLSLILGGAEVRLWDLANVYSKMSKSLTTYNESGESASYSDISWALNPSNKKSSSKSLLDPGSTWLAFEALTEMDRPVEGTQWNNFSSSKKIAWKTGTSFGFRDAWSVGVTPDYVVGVWVGNADGEGRPELTGARSAAPILFDIFKFLPGNEWFEAPFEDMLEVPVCANSGYKASINCGKIDTVLVSKAATKAQTCPFHKLIHLNTEETRQVNGDCYRVSDMVTKPWFILPPVMEWYYKSKDPYYKILPRYAAGCNPVESNNMALIYPKVAAEIFIPKGFDQKKERVNLSAVDRSLISAICADGNFQ
ncbi:MAG: penicillin-binding protein 1C, partial [Bacteroidota bacterium]